MSATEMRNYLASLHAERAPALTTPTTAPATAGLRREPFGPRLG